VRKVELVGEASPGREDRPSERSPDDGVHPTWRFARYLSAYRGNLSRGEAARRSGLPEALWERVEGTDPSETVPDLLPAAIVAAMCVTVGADVATGLQLAGHRPDLYPYLVERPPVYTPLTGSSQAPTGPYIATPHVVAEVLAVESEDAHRRMAVVYRQLALSNWQMANRILENRPDEREEYWVGYAAAIRAIAEQQAWAADQEELHTGSAVLTTE
jgi:hypothetical protein